MNTTARMFLCGLLLSQTAAAENPGDYVGSNEWQQRRLFAPNVSELQQEAAGRVFIYDGLMEADVERALDDQFQRLDSMMFIRTKRQLPKGDVVVVYEDDDC